MRLPLSVVNVHGYTNYTFTLFLSSENVATQVWVTVVSPPSNNPCEGSPVIQMTLKPTKQQALAIECDGLETNIVDAWRRMSRIDSRFRIEHDWNLESL